MDDQFLSSGLRPPQADFTRQLRDRLHRMDAENAVRRQPRPMARVAAYAAAVLLALSAFALPSVQAGARAFLDLFRVVNFAPVAVQTDRISALMKSQDLDVPRMLGEQVQVLKAAGQIETVPTVEFDIPSVVSSPPKTAATSPVEPARDAAATRMT